MTEPRTQSHPFDAASLPEVELHGPRRTVVMRGAHENDHIFATMVASGQFYEQGLLDYLTSLIAPGGLVVDVGANIGTHTVWFASQHSCDVRAFEAVPETAQVLCANVQLNGLDGEVRIEPYAVGRGPGRVSVAHWDPENSGATRLQQEASRDNRSSFAMVRLDDLEWEARVVLVKIDVEGMELDVLAGAEELVRRDRPVVVAEAQDASAETALRSWFQERGYTVLARVNATPTLVATPTKGADASGVNDVVARSLEHLMSRFDEFDARLDRFGRYVHSLRQTPAETESAVDPGGVPSPAVVEALRRRIAELENQLSAARWSADARHDSTPEDRS